MVGQLLDVVHQAVEPPLPIDLGVPAQCDAMEPLVVSQVAEDRLGPTGRRSSCSEPVPWAWVSTPASTSAPPSPPRCALAGRIVTVPEYMKQIKLINAKAADVYRYMNFDQIPAFVQQAAMVEM